MRLDVYDGTQRRVLDLAAAEIRIGRGSACEVVLHDPTISRVHAVLRRSADGWVAEDLGSRNGTFCNGERLTEPVLLKATDRLLIGSHVLVLRDTDDEEETAAAGAASARRAASETGLSRREVEILRLVCAGRSDQQIADILVISVKTVHSHLDRIREKTGARRRPELIRFGIQHGLA